MVMIMLIILTRSFFFFTLILNHRRAYDTYSFQVIPPLGEVVAGDWKSYQYLVESIRKFPTQVIIKNDTGK